MRTTFRTATQMALIPLVGFLLTLTACVGVPGDVRKLIVPDQKFPDMGITNEVHKANIGKIVFSSLPVDFEKPDPKALRTSFSQDDDIYARFYLGESLENHVFGEKRVKVTYPKFECALSIDGVLQPLVIDKDSAMPDARETTRQLWIRVPRGRSGWGDTGEWVKLVNSAMKPGKHEVKLELKSLDSGKVVASGVFSYTKGASPARYGTSFKDYEAGMKDAALEKRMLETVKRELVWKDQAWTGIKIFSDDWSVVRHANGTILSRSLGAWVQSKKNDGTYWVRAFFLGQEYNGSGYNQSFFVMERQDAEEVDE
jgi:hypothetical protein